MNLIYKKYKAFGFSLVLLFLSISCEEQLEEKPFDQLAPSNILTTEGGLESVLVSAYGNFQWHRFPLIQIHYLEEGPSDLFFETDGGQARQASHIQEFTFDPEHPWIEAVYNRLWNAIRDANLFLDNVENVEFKNVDKNLRIGETRFIRAFEYYLLSKWFGGVPLITSSNPEIYPEKVSLSEINTFIETELREAADVLPTTQQETYRITKGAALGALTKFYLNTKQWEKTATVAKEIMDLNIYSLYPDYAEMFAHENELNSEFMLVMPNERVAGLGTEWMALSLPPGFVIEGSNFAAQFRYYDSFVSSFDPEDGRADFFLTEYVKDGQNIQLLGKDNSRSLKFFDAERIGADAGNDFPVIRYADILLSRAEALNELNGPNQESIGLINQIRARAGENLALLDMGDFNKETLRDHILDERGWEFYSESKRRSDLIRHGKFIQSALERGKSAAKAYQVLYPFPQTEINANENLVQNEGY